MNWQSSVVDPVLHVVVVGFHHKKGCQVEYSYPPLVEGNDVASHECPKKWKHLPSLALPDGAHNYSEDTIYFHLPSLDGSQNTIFGVSCCQQIDASEVLNKPEDMTRNTIQKSVCVLSRLPVFGLIRVKLEMITHAYFKGRDFSQVELLEDTYSTLNSSLTECLLQNSHINLGLSGREMLKMFRHKLVVLFKLFLLEKKVLFFSSPVKPICTSILAISSLFPGLIEQGLFESARFDAAQMTPTIEARPSFQLPKDVNKSILPEPSTTRGPESVSQDAKTDISKSPQKQDSIAEHSDRKAGSLTKSLQQLPQQKWGSITFSQLRSKFFSNFKGNNGSSSQSLFFTSLPSIPLSTDTDGKQSPKGNSVFYSKASPIIDPAESYHQETANSTFFIAPNLCQTSSEFDDEQSKTSTTTTPQNPVENSNQAPIHFSRQSSLSVEKSRSHSINIDVKDITIMPMDHDNRSLPLNFDKNPKFTSKLETSQNPPPATKVARTSENCFGFPDTLTASDRTLAIAGEVTRSCNTNLEDMLVDDDDIIFKEGQHRLEINEFPPDPLTQEMDSGEVGPFSELKVTKSIEHLPLHLKANLDSGPSSFVSGSDCFGLPLMIFSKGVLCHPYLSLHLYDVLTDPGVRGFVIGATNALFMQRRQLLDVIVELGEARIDMVDGDLKRCLALSTADLRFADNLVKSLIEESGDPFLDNTGWEGGDDWIRSQFRSYLMSLLATVDHGDEKMEEDFNPCFIEAWKMTHNYKVWKENSPYDALSSIPAQHICRGNLSMSDVKLKINQVINNGGKERRLTSVVNQTVSQTGKAVGAAVNLAKSTVSSWFGGFSNKD